MSLQIGEIVNKGDHRKQKLLEPGLRGFQLKKKQYSDSILEDVSREM
jgi:hypothetical protein